LQADTKACPIFFLVMAFSLGSAPGIRRGGLIYAGAFKQFLDKPINFQVPGFPVFNEALEAGKSQDFGQAIAFGVH